MEDSDAVPESPAFTIEVAATPSVTTPSIFGCDGSIVDSAPQRGKIHRLEHRAGDEDALRSGSMHSKRRKSVPSLLSVGSDFGLRGMFDTPNQSPQESIGNTDDDRDDGDDADVDATEESDALTGADTDMSPAQTPGSELLTPGSGDLSLLSQGVAETPVAGVGGGPSLLAMARARSRAKMTATAGATVSSKMAAALRRRGLANQKRARAAMSLAEVDDPTEGTARKSSKAKTKSSIGAKSTSSLSSSSSSAFATPLTDADNAYPTPKPPGSVASSKPPARSTRSVSSRASMRARADMMKSVRSYAASQEGKQKKKARGGSLTSSAMGGDRTPRTPAVVPKTPASVRHISYIATLIEYRNRLEVGMVLMSSHTTELLMYQYTDKNSYHQTLALLEQYEPAEIIFPDTAEQSALFRKAAQKMELSQVKCVQRKYFNEASGSTLLRKQCTKESLASIKLDSSLYLGLAASSACLKYMEFTLNVHFAPQSLRVCLKSLRGYMRIDAGSIQNLELVANLKNPKSKAGTLFGLMDLCKTPMGSRLLRSSLFQPLSDIETLNARLDAVEQLLEQEEVFYGLCAVLPSMADLDQLVTHLSRIPKNPNEASKQYTITNVLQLKRTLKMLPEIQKSLSPCDNPLLKHIGEILIREDSDIISELVGEILEEGAADTATSMKSAGILHTQLAFAVKSGIDPMLDVARATYKEVIEDIHKEIALCQESGPEVSSLKIQFTVGRGFHLSMPKRDAPNLPDVYIQRVFSGKRVSFTTDNLLSLDDRRREAYAEIITLTDKVLQNLLDEVRQHMHWLQVVAEAIAYLDMILAFANLVTQRSSLVRPHFTEDGPIAIRNGRHPVVELVSTRDYVPNDLFLTENANFHLITGPNASGKSTYLRQICVMIVMAFIGVSSLDFRLRLQNWAVALVSYVPATYASFRVVDQIFTRLSNSDDPESNQSTFFKEMKETAFILQNAGGRSFVAIDELGRGTSTLDGIAVAWSAAEDLMQRKCFTLFTTHFFELAELADLYPNIKHKTLKVGTETHGKLDFLFKLVNAKDTDGKRVENYGIYIAQVAGFPLEVIERARAAVGELREKVKQSKESNGEAERTRAAEVSVYTLIDQLNGLKYTRLPQEQLTQLLLGLKAKFKPVLEELHGGAPRSVSRNSTSSTKKQRSATSSISGKRNDAPQDCATRRELDEADETGASQTKSGKLEVVG